MQIDLTEEEIDFIGYVIDNKLQNFLVCIEEVRTSEAKAFYNHRIKLCKNLIIKFNNCD